MDESSPSIGRVKEIGIVLNAENSKGINCHFLLFPTDPHVASRAEEQGSRGATTTDSAVRAETAGRGREPQTLIGGKLQGKMVTMAYLSLHDVGFDL